MKADQDGVPKRNQGSIRDYSKLKNLQPETIADDRGVTDSSVQRSFTYRDDGYEDDFIADSDVLTGAEEIALSAEVTQLLSIIGIEGAEHLLRRKQLNGAAESAQQLSHLEESANDSYQDTQSQHATELRLVEPAKIFTPVVVPEAETACGLQESGSPDNVRVPWTSSNDGRLEMLDSPEINVTRIIIGNLDIFIDRHPYFMDKIGGWIKVRSLIIVCIIVDLCAYVYLVILKMVKCESRI